MYSCSLVLCLQKKKEQQFGTVLDGGTTPYQFALSTRAGTDAPSHLLRATTETDPNVVVVAIDGVGAFDHIRRKAIFDKLLAVPKLQSLVPFVRLFYGSPTTYLWEDELDNSREAKQGEGGEQGDALMPALFALGLHPALQQADELLEEGEWLGAFLDDVYLVTTRERAKAAFDTVAAQVKAHAGVDVNFGKCAAWSAAGGEAPPGLAELGDKVWRCTQPAAENGLVVLGAPLVAQSSYQTLQQNADLEKKCS